MTEDDKPEIVWEGSVAMPDEGMQADFLRRLWDAIAGIAEAEPKLDDARLFAVAAISLLNRYAASFGDMETQKLLAFIATHHLRGAGDELRSPRH